MTNKEHDIESLRRMQGRVPYVFARPKIPTSKEKIVSKIPMLNRFLHKLDLTGEAVLRVSEQGDLTHTVQSDEALQHGFHFGSVVIAVLDFLRIPVIYFAAYILKEKVPISLNNNAKWFYAALVLGLTLTAFVVPAAAPIIGFFMAGMSLVISTTLLIKIVNERYQLSKQQKNLRKELHKEALEMDAIQREAVKLESSLLQNEAESDEINSQITQLTQRFEVQKQKIEALKNEEIQVTQKIADLHVGHVVKKSIGMLFATATIIGLILAIFLPPVGLGILTAVAIAGATYLLVRVTVPLSEFIMDSLKAPPEEENNQIVKDVDEAYKAQNELVLQDEEEEVEEIVHESTADVFIALKGNKSVEELRLESVELMDDEGPVFHPMEHAPTPELLPQITEKEDVVEAEKEDAVDGESGTDIEPK